MEFSLEDTLETLTDSQKNREKQIENVTIEILNNKLGSLDWSTVSEEVRKKQQKLCHCLSKEIHEFVHSDYPIPNTPDIRIQALADLQEEVQNTQRLFSKMEENLLEINNDISYLENKKKGLETMKASCEGAVEMTANRSYENEYRITTRMFKEVKKDLYTLVSKIFPDNVNFENVLADLTRAYTKGGDDVYIDITPEVLTCLNFLLEADIVVYHRNNANKIRLTEML